MHNFANLPQSEEDANFTRANERHFLTRTHPKKHKENFFTDNFQARN
jgi:hypothetical protein